MTTSSSRPQDDGHAHPHPHEEEEHGHAHPHPHEEEEHGHPHEGEEHGHEHGPGGHSHTHRSGVLGWFQSTFAHSHDAADKIDDAMESSERGFWATKWALVSLGLTTVIQVVIVWFSGSTALFADTVHNFADGANSIPLLIAFGLQRRARSRQFTYGYGRTEDLAGLFIVITIAISAIVAGTESIRDLFNPEPMNYLGWVAAAAVIGFIGNEAVAILQIRTGKQIGSAALIADGKHARIDGLTSLAVLVAVFGTLLGVPILDPIIGLVITATILVILKSASISIFRRMLDAVEPELLDQAERTVAGTPGVRAVEQVRMRWLGHRMYVEADIVVDAALDVSAAHRITDDVQHRLHHAVNNLGEVVVHVHPDGAPDLHAATAHHRTAGTT